MQRMLGLSFLLHTPLAKIRLRWQWKLRVLNKFSNKNNQDGTWPELPKLQVPWWATSNFDSKGRCVPCKFMEEGKQVAAVLSLLAVSLRVYLDPDSSERVGIAGWRPCSSHKPPEVQRLRTETGAS